MEEIKYKIKRERIKNLYISVNNGEVIVKAPMIYPKYKIDELIENRKNWILKSIKKQNNKIVRDVDLSKRDYIYVLNNKIHVEVIRKNIKSAMIEKEDSLWNIYIPLDYTIDKVNILVNNELRKIATKYVKIIMEDEIKITGLTPKSYSIRKMKRVWGNCSSLGEIKINQNVIWFGLDEIRYVCLHELCHLKHMNHSKSFWNLVRKYMPNYKEIANNMK